MAEIQTIGIMSDSHDNRDSIAGAVRIFNEAGCTLVIHAGDIVAPFTAREFKHLNCPFIGVFGNNDGEKKGLTAQFSELGGIFEPPHEFEHGRVRFAVMHEPDYLDSYIGRDDFDVIVYGHTHNIDIREGTPKVVNPGECCSWLTGRSTVVLMELPSLATKVIELGND